MASGIRKTRVLAKDLPPVIRLEHNSYGFLTRYRIISEDRNRFSSWSKISPVVMFDENNPPEQVDLNISIMENSIFIVWGDEANRPSYDIFVKFDDKEYFYHGTSPIHSYSILNKDPDTGLEAARVDVAIQVESINKEKNDVLTVASGYAIMES